MGGFVDPFVPEPAWPQDTMFLGSSWPGSAPSSLADPASTYLGGAAAAAAPDQFRLLTGFPSTGALLTGSAKETMVSPVEQFLSAHLPHLPDDVNFEVDDSVLTTPCAISLADSAPVVCSSNDSSGSEQSGLPPRFLLGEQAAWASTFPHISSLVGEETSQSFGFGGAVSSNDLLLPSKGNDLLRHGKKYPQLGNAPAAPLQLHDDVEFDAGKMLSFTPGHGQQVNTTNFGDLLLSQKEFSGLQHLNLSGQQQLSLFNATGATHKHEQPSEVSSGKIGPKAQPFMIRPEVPNGNGAAGNGAPKPRVRARRGQATDPHSIAERLRREKISDRMKDLQELVPNSNRTDKASMLEEIIEYVKFLQLQVKVLSMSRLGATEAVVPLLTESHTESSGGLLLPPRSGSGSGRQRAGRGSLSSSSEARDGAASEQEVARLMESNMTTAMQYLQSKGLCIMPIALASAISDQKGTSSTAVQPEHDGAKEMLLTVKPLGSPIQGR